MNPYTGHLIGIGDDETMARAVQSGHLPVPRRLMDEAKAELAGKTEATVDLQAKTPLADWAKKKRKAKAAAKSRRRNRG